jgi:hypothetical protein
MFEWGSVPVWVGTVFTCISVAIAVATYWRATADKQRDQAARVGSWVTDTAEEWAETPHESGNYEGWVVVRLFIANRSDAPIYDIRIRWRKPEDADDPLPRDRRFEELKESELGPGVTAYKPLILRLRKAPGPEVTRVLLGEPLLKEFAVPEIHFTDALGRTWIRTSSRKLRRTSRWGNTRMTSIGIPVEQGGAIIPYH